MTATFVYPTTEYDQPDTLLALLGSFWQSTYQDQLVEDLAVAYAMAAKQSHSDMLELVATCGRSNVPVLHQQHWYHLVLKQSEHNAGEGAVLHQYGSGIVYGPQPDTGIQYKYGEAQTGYSTFPLPSGLRECGGIFNRITQPSVSLVPGVDYLIDVDNGVIIFRDNPFDNANVATRKSYSGDTVTDEEASFWLFQPKFDRDDVYTQFGYPFQFDLSSSETYKAAVNGLWDGLVRGTTTQDIQSVVSAICDVPFAAGTEEVEVVFANDSALLIVTDQNVYSFHPNATALVAVGDTVYAGQALADPVKFYEFNQGDPGDLQAITLGTEFLPSGYYDGVTFYNETADVEVDTSGVFAEVSFHVGGWAGDVERFWDEFASKGIVAGSTLANLLDQRTNKVGEPTADNLPTTINPLEFLAENVLRDNAFAARINVSKLGPDAVSLQHLRQLRRLIVPSTTMLVITELDAPDDTATLTEYVAEGLEPYLGAEPYQDTALLPNYAQESVASRYIEGHCI